MNKVKIGLTKSHITAILILTGVIMVITAFVMAPTFLFEGTLIPWLVFVGGLYTAYRGFRRMENQKSAG